MATALRIHLSLETDTGIFSSGVREDTARAASEALQLDMQNHHVFVNDQGVPQYDFFRGFLCH